MCGQIKKKEEENQTVFSQMIPELKFLVHKQNKNPKVGGKTLCPKQK